MSREIKFRQWMDGRFFYWGFVEDSVFASPASSNQCGGLNANNTDHQQYTGLLDKNGKEIYEGDIIQHTGFAGHLKSAIKWDNSRMGWTAFHPRDEFIVIGNVHENPELLQGE